MLCCILFLDRYNTGKQQQHQLLIGSSSSSLVAVLVWQISSNSSSGAACEEMQVNMTPFADWAIPVSTVTDDGY